jgi:acetyl esterase/lipase
MRSFKSVASTCIERITELLRLEEIEAPLQRVFLKVDPTTIEPWRGIMENNTPGKLPPGAPVLILQGTADDLVRPKVSQQFADHLCAGGAVVEMRWLEGVSHAFAGYDGADTAVRWMEDRFHGRPATNGCKR